MHSYLVWLFTLFPISVSLNIWEHFLYVLYGMKNNDDIQLLTFIRLVQGMCRWIPAGHIVSFPIVLYLKKFCCRLGIWTFPLCWYSLNQVMMHFNIYHVYIYKKHCMWIEIFMSSSGSDFVWNICIAIFATSYMP